MDSYLWVIAYFISIVSEMVYVKYIITEIGENSTKEQCGFTYPITEMTTWGRVFYNNLLSIPPVLFFGYLFNDHVALLNHEWNTESVVFLILSCAVSIGISYAGFFLRVLISATSFTVVGVVNKIATTIMNLLMWDKHAGMVGDGWEMKRLTKK